MRNKVHYPKSHPHVSFIYVIMLTLAYCLKKIASNILSVYIFLLPSVEHRRLNEQRIPMFLRADCLVSDSIRNKIGRCSKYCQRAKYCQLPIKRTIVIIYTINYFLNTFATIFFLLIVYLIVYCISSAFNWQLTVFGSLTVFGIPP